MQTVVIVLGALLSVVFTATAGMLAWSLKKLIDIDKRLAVMNAGASLGAQLKIKELRELVDEYREDFEELREGHTTLAGAMSVLTERFNNHHHAANRRISQGGPAQ